MSTHEIQRQHAILRCRERGVVIPTLSQPRDPSRVPEANGSVLTGVDLKTQLPARDRQIEAFDRETGVREGVQA